MYAVDISNITDERRKVLVSIQADTPPDSLPTTGETVTNLADDVTFAVGSSLYVVSTGAVYFYGEDSEWHIFGNGGSND